MRYYILLFIALLVLPLASSAPPVNPFATTSQTSLELEAPSFYYIPQNTDHRFHVHVINQTRIKTNVTTQCFLHVYNSTGFDIDTSGVAMDFESYNGIDFAKTVSGGNFSNLGYYAFVIQCNSTNEVGFISGQLLVTKSGFDIAGDNFTVLIYLLFIVSSVVLFYTLFLTLAKLVTADETIYDVLISWSGYILMIIVNYLAGEYLLREFVVSLSGKFLTYTVYTNVVLPLVAFVISFFIKSTQKKRVLTPQEVGGFRYG